MTKTLPHDPYITAVVEALTTGGLEPTDWWTSGAETDPWGDGCEMMLNAVLRWNEDHSAVDEDELPDGMLLLWEHPADEWQHADMRADGGNEYSEFLPQLGRLADPVHVVTVVRELLAGRKAPEVPMVPWGQAAATENAITAWAADDETEVSR